jgi:hypothetical protein
VPRSGSPPRITNLSMNESLELILARNLGVRG